MWHSDKCRQSVPCYREFTDIQSDWNQPPPLFSYHRDGMTDIARRSSSNIPCIIWIWTNEIMPSDSCKSRPLVIEVIKSHDGATALRNTSLSTVTKVPWQRSDHLIGKVKIINIHVFRSFEDDLLAMPVRPWRRYEKGAGFNQTDWYPKGFFHPKCPLSHTSNILKLHYFFINLLYFKAQISQTEGAVWCPLRNIFASQVSDSLALI